MKILIVDDSRVARHTLRKALAEGLINTEFFEADSGRNALSLIHQNPPDLIFTDWYMDDMDGLELTRTVKEGMATSKICAMTSETNPDRQKLLHEAGVDYILTKPLKIHELAKAMELLLG